MDLYLDTPDDTSKRELSDEILCHFDQETYEKQHLSYNKEQDTDNDIDDDDPLLSIERIGSFKRKSKLVNGKGYLFIKKGSQKMPLS